MRSNDYILGASRGCPCSRCISHFYGFVLTFECATSPTFFSHLRLFLRAWSATCFPALRRSVAHTNSGGGAFYARTNSGIARKGSLAVFLRVSGVTPHIRSRDVGLSRLSPMTTKEHLHTVARPRSKSSSKKLMSIVTSCLLYTSDAADE